MIESNLSLPNGVDVSLVEGDSMFQGLGEVRVGGLPLRAAARPMFVEIRTPRGELMRDFRLGSSSQLSDGGYRLEFSMSVEAAGLMEWMVHEVRPRYNTADWAKGPAPATDTALQLEIHPRERTIGGREYRGFTYQYHYRSEAYPVYKILDRATWEIGGDCRGNEFWMRNCFVPSTPRFDAADQFFSTEWFIPDCANPSAFQFLPLQTELQGFTFTASEAGVLVTWPSEVAHVRSLFEKPRGENLLVHFHEHCGDLNSQFSTSPVEVLFAPGARDRVKLYNDYEAMRELVHETLHRQLGMRRERVTSYGQIEEWGPADLDYYASEGVPKLLEAGCRTVYFANHFQNNMNTWDVGNFCCTVDYKVSENVGEANLRALFAKVRAGGATPEMWGNTSISSLSWILGWDRHRQGTGDPAGRIDFLPFEGSVMDVLSRAEAPFVRNASNAIEADHYTPQFCALNLRDPVVRAYWLQSWKTAHDETGLGGIFLDSSYNLSSDKFHWVQNAAPESTQGATADQVHLLGRHRPAQEPPSAILSQYRAHLDLMRAMQQLGYVYCNEDLGVFGVHRHGPSIGTRLESLPLWSDCITGFDCEEILAAGADPQDVFFRGLAYRMVWSLCWDIESNALCWNYGGPRAEYDYPDAGQLQLLRAFNEVEPLMQQRTILPGETGVLYTSPSGPAVLWAFADMERPTDFTGPLREVLSGEEVPSSQSLSKGCVYLNIS